MKSVAVALSAAAIVASTPVLAGDPVVGKQKATACIACHGSDTYPGIFYTLQLGGRNADKLATKTMKYKTGKVLHPMMNLAVAFFDEKEIQDIAAYYQSLGKPAFTSPMIKIKGDNDADAALAPAYVPMMAYPVAPAAK
jgi:cytochrome c553